MKTVEVKRKGGALEIVDRNVPKPGSGEVRIRVEACGICHSDGYVPEGTFPGIAYPRVPGHEVAGVVDEVGPNVRPWKAGDKVGVGWHGGHCNVCDRCRRGDFVLCKEGQATGISRDGGYTEHMIARAEAVARIPDGLSFAEAAPLLCAGITTYNALRHSGARPGDLVAVQGIGGLGHLGVQFANKMGFETVAIGRGREKETLARKLGAAHYMDSEKEEPAKALAARGGARVILATAPSAKAMAPLVEGLAPDGKLLVVGADFQPVPISLVSLIAGRRSISGWPSGSAIDSEDTLRFAALTGVRPMIEAFPLERVRDAFERAMTGKAQFRVVLKLR